MKITSYFSIFFLSVLVFISCKKEEALTPTTKPEYGYHVLGGNTPYDQRILDYYNRFGTYMLYSFTKIDAYWNVVKMDSTYNVIPADTAYVNQQLNLIDTTFFRYYQDSTLRRCLPVKFLLCSSIKKNNTGAQLDGYLTDAPTSNTAGYTNENFIANWGSSRILKVHGGTKDSAVIFRGNINYGFLRLLDLKQKTGKSDVFAAAADYVSPVTPIVQNAMYKRGFLGTSAPNGQVVDWYNYIQAIVQNPYTFLTDPATTPTDATYKGILTSVKDSSGLIRKKYDAITNYYKVNYNIDLQRIGDGRP